MRLPSLPRPAGRFHDLPLAIKSITGFWLFYLATVMVRSLFGGGLNNLLSTKLVGVLVGIAITFLVYVAIRLLAGNDSLRRMIVVAAIACVPAALIFALVNFTMFYMYAPMVTREIATERAEDGTVLSRTASGVITIERKGAPSLVLQSQSIRELVRQQAPRAIADDAVIWYFFLAAWASFYLAMSSANQLRLAERRAADFERAAQAAQLRALRYQVNPHFLFNTLNSLSSLIMARRDEEAEKMVMNLSNFFRSTLATDPTADVSLAEEVALQRLYLDIEQARFPKRLRVDFVIPDALQRARIPALLLQPAVENAIKYGVARTRDPVTLSIRASDQDGQLRIEIENDGPDAGEDCAGGTGVGLANMRQRLKARFGPTATLAHGPRGTGGYRVILLMPLVNHD